MPASKSQKRPTADQKARVIRPLGAFEGYQSALHMTGMYTSTSITCRYMIPEDLAAPAVHASLVEFWEHAVANTVLQHPLLQVGLINGDARKASWVRLDHVDLSKHIEWQIVEDLESLDSVFNDVSKKDLASGYSNLETQPGWRMIVLRVEKGNFIDVMFSWNHANFDGSGAAIFHKTLIHQLNTMSRKSRQPALENHLVKTTVSAKNFTIPVEVTSKFPITLGYAAQTVWKELKPPMLAKSLPYHASWAPIKLTPYKTGLRRMKIDNRTLQNVLSACRVHDTTLTGLLHGITLVSLVSQLQEQDLPALVGETALNLRRHLQTAPPKHPDFNPHKTMANYVSTMNHEFGHTTVSKIRNLVQSATTETGRSPALEEAMWEVSATVREEIQQRIDLGLKNDIVGLMKVVLDWRDYIKDELKKPRAAAFVVTNLGVIDGAPTLATGLKDEAPWSIQRAIFSLSAAIFGPVFSISAISVKGGELCVDVSWHEPAVDAAIGDRLVADLQSWLGHIGSLQ